MTGHFLRGGVVYGFDPALLLVWFCILFLKLKQEIHHRYPRLPFRDSRAYRSAKSAAYAKRKRPQLHLFLPLPVKNPQSSTSPALVAFLNLELHLIIFHLSH